MYQLHQCSLKYVLYWDPFKIHILYTCLFSLPCIHDCATYLCFSRIFRFEDQPSFFFLSIKYILNMRRMPVACMVPPSVVFTCKRQGLLNAGMLIVLAHALFFTPPPPPGILRRPYALHETDQAARTSQLACLKTCFPSFFLTSNV